MQTMDMALAEALWRLEKLPVQALEELAASALMQGFDGPALRELAWPHASWGEVGELFRQALAEMGRAPIDREGAIAQLIRSHAADIVAGRVDPFEGARKLFYEVWWDIENLDDYGSISELLLWANVDEDDPTRSAEFKAKILQRAHELLAHDPIEHSRRNPAHGELSPRQAAWITADLCILLMNQVEPTFQRRWRSYAESWGAGDKPGLYLYMAEFAGHTADLAIQGATGRVKNILEQVEQLLQEGDADVQNAAATCFLEGLVHKDDLPAGAYVPLLGPRSVDYIRAWDKFTGVRTEGLWDDDDRD